VEKNTPSFTSKPADQGDLFMRLSNHEPDYLAANAPELDIEQEFMGAIKHTLRTARKHGLSRDRIVDRMNLCLPEDLYVTKRQIDAWCAASQEYKHFPAIYLAPFIWAVGGIVSPLEVITRVLGLHVIDEHEQMAAELGRTTLIKVQANNKERDIKKAFQLFEEKK